MTQAQTDQVAVLQAQIALATAQYNQRINMLNTQITTIESAVNTPVTSTS